MHPMVHGWGGGEAGRYGRVETLPFRRFHSEALLRHEGLARLSELGRGSWDQPLEGERDFLRMETEGPGPALIGDAAVIVDNVEAIGPARVGLLGRVVDVIDQGGEMNAQLGEAILSNGTPLLEILRRRHGDLFFDIGFRLPGVDGMR